MLSFIYLYLSLSFHLGIEHMEDSDAQGLSDVPTCSHHEVEVLQDNKACYSVDYYAAGD